MKVLKALGSGFVGACALTLLHETARRVIPDAPRMDVLGMQAIAKSMRKMEQTPPPDEELHTMALAGDVVSNSLYYSLVGIGKAEGVWRRGALVGLGAGVGAVLLPERLGLDDAPSARTPATQLMTVGWYLFGGLVAAAAFSLVNKQPARGRARQRVAASAEM